MTRINRPTYKAFNFTEYVFTWSIKFAWGCLVGGASGMGVTLMLIDIFYLEMDYRKLVVASLLAGLMCAGAGLVYALMRRAYLFDELMLDLLDEPKPITAVPSRPVERDHSMSFDLKNGYPAVLIRQPRPAAFSSWLRQVVENPKIQFSENQAKMRGWSIEGYKVLVAQLREIGLLHQHDMKNNAPVMTDHGRELARRWLRDG